MDTAKPAIGCQPAKYSYLVIRSPAAKLRLLQATWKVTKTNNNQQSSAGNLGNLPTVHQLYLVPETNTTPPKRWALTTDELGYSTTTKRWPLIQHTFRVQQIKPNIQL